MIKFPSLFYKKVIKSHPSFVLQSVARGKYFDLYFWK